MKGDNRTVKVVLIVIGIIPVTWAALVVAPFVSQGLNGIIAGFTEAIKHPPPLTWCEDSMKTILVCLMCYGLGLGVYYSSQHNYRRGMEHGSAKWGSPKALCRKYADKMESENVILTENVRIGLNGRKHRRNLNILCVGGSGSGKTRHYAKVNILQANTSLLVLDVKGEILRDTSRLLEEKGY